MNITTAKNQYQKDLKKKKLQSLDYVATKKKKIYIYIIHTHTHIFGIEANCHNDWRALKGSAQEKVGQHFTSLGQ